MHFIKAAIAVCLLALVAGARATLVEAGLPPLGDNASLRGLLDAKLTAAEQKIVSKTQAKALEAVKGVFETKKDSMVDTLTTVKDATVKAADKVNDANQKVYEAIKAANQAKFRSVATGFKAILPGNDGQDSIAAAKAAKAVDSAHSRLQQAKSSAAKAQVKAHGMVQKAAVKATADAKADIAAAQQKAVKLAQLAQRVMIKAGSD